MATPSRAADCPVLPLDDFRRTVIECVASRRRLSALFGRPCDGSGIRLFAVLAQADAGDLAVTSTDGGTRSTPALTPDCPQAHWFEREIAEQWDVRPLGHPWLKPIRFQPPRGA